MKIWIVYDSKFGSNIRIAALMQELLSPNHEVHVSYAKKISPKAVLATNPDALLFGGPRRIGKISYTLRSWVKRYAKTLQKKQKRMVKIAAWETRGEIKPETANAESKMERNIYEKNLKTGELWSQLIKMLPVEQPPQELLSLSIINETSLGNGQLEPEYEAKVRTFIQRFEA
ncbi:MAG: hypothetical protein E4G98_07385 [Promethearchaeota archaeon]|nr:MAG: hypothetical protein E4G98_07385 [Candidatus Lokiarchaeota archaeon]